MKIEFTKFTMKYRIGFRYLIKMEKGLKKRVTQCVLWKEKWVPLNASPSTKKEWEEVHAESISLFWKDKFVKEEGRLKTLRKLTLWKQYGAQPFMDRPLRTSVWRQYWDRKG